MPAIPAIPATFAEAVAASLADRLHCPRCGRPLACVYGCCWDRDSLFCPCGWEHEYESTSCPDDLPA